MTDPLPTLVADSLQIAWDFLDASGEIEDPQQTAEVLLGAIKTLLLRGENRKLVLSNRAIAPFGSSNKPHDDRMSLLPWSGMGVREPPEVGMA